MPRKNTPPPAQRNALGLQVMDELEYLGSQYLALRASGLAAGDYGQRYGQMMDDSARVLLALIEQGADLDVRDEEENTPIDLALGSVLPPRILFMFIPSLRELDEWLVHQMCAYEQARAGHAPAEEISIEQWRILERLPKSIDEEDTAKWYGIHPALRALRDGKTLQSATCQVSRHSKTRL